MEKFDYSVPEQCYGFYSITSGYRKVAYNSCYHELYKDMTMMCPDSPIYNIIFCIMIIAIALAFMFKLYKDYLNK